MIPHPAPETGPILGKLSLEALPLHEPILVATFIGVVIGGIAVLGLITKFRLWGYLWTEWFTTVDHKRIGIMYMILGDRRSVGSGKGVSVSVDLGGRHIIKKKNK